jgi:hypothetical protein
VNMRLQTHKKGRVSSPAAFMSHAWGCFFFRQSWALAHFFEVRYPLPTQFFPLDR